MRIKSINARQILDSRGSPTIEVDLLLNCGGFGRASAPSGASVGGREALELRDGKKDFYFGRSVMQAVLNVNNPIKDAIINKNFESQKELDELLIKLDGTKNKSNFGANALIATSVAFMKACANSSNIELFKMVRNQIPKEEGFGDLYVMPRPMCNLINGGQHADNDLLFQEFMIIPSAKYSIEDAIEILCSMFNALKSILHAKSLSINTGDEGGFAPNIRCAEEALDLLMLAAQKINIKPYEDFSIAIDVAANHIYANTTYRINDIDNDLKLSYAQLIRYYKILKANYPISSIEDGMDENDIEGWKALTAEIGNEMQLVGDDIFVTNKEIIQKYLKEKIANAVIIKINQIGTLTEAIEAAISARRNKYSLVASHRSGETEDVFLSHFAVGINSEYIKTGSVSRCDRTAKYNELLRINENI